MNVQNERGVRIVRTAEVGMCKVNDIIKCKWCAKLFRGYRNRPSIDIYFIAIYTLCRVY